MKATANWDAASINLQTGFSIVFLWLIWGSKTAYTAPGIQVHFSALEVSSYPAAVESVSRRQGETILARSDLDDDLRF